MSLIWLRGQDWPSMQVGILQSAESLDRTKTGKCELVSLLDLRDFSSSLPLEHQNSRISGLCYFRTHNSSPLVLRPQHLSESFMIGFPGSEGFGSVLSHAVGSAFRRSTMVLNTFNHMSQFPYKSPLICLYIEPVGSVSLTKKMTLRIAGPERM